MEALPSVGVDIGGTKLLAVRLEPDGSVVADHIQASPRSGPELVDEVLATVERLCGGPAGSLGVGVPGLVDDTDVVRFAPNLPGATGSSLGSAFRQSLPGTSIWIGNDATAACWAEHDRGAGAGFADMVMVTLGTGIGGGIVFGHSLFEGRTASPASSATWWSTPTVHFVHAERRVLGAFRVWCRPGLAGPGGGHGRPRRTAGGAGRGRS